MSRTITALFTLALVACVGAAAADPPGRVARLNHVAGTVSFAAAEAPQHWIEAVVNRPLTSGDRLWVDDSARAELHVGSTALRLDSFTSLDVLNLDDETLQVRLAQGAVNLRVRELARDEIVEIATPAGAVLIRQPGSYRIESGRHDDVSRIVVNFGQAEVVTPAQTVTVPSSQGAVVPVNAPIALELAAHAYGDEFDRWSADRDRREDRVTSTRYVSRDMTGYEDLDQHGAWRTLPEYGAVWVPARVAPGWAPYRHGHWSWISPWGWTWIDDAPWGFAPFHYGRWVWLGNYWGWAPGPIVRRPVYAPALVAFIGGSGFSVGVSSAPAIGWFPLGWREPFVPWYRASHAHMRNVNVTHVSHVTRIHDTNIDYVNRRRREAVTVVPHQTFVSARPVAQSSVAVRQDDLVRAQVIRERSPAEPVRASIAPERPGSRPPALASTREVLAINPPASREARAIPSLRERGANARSDDEPRVRVLRRDRNDLRNPEPALQQSAREQALGASSGDAPAREAQPGVPIRSGARAGMSPPSSLPAPAAAQSTVSPAVTPAPSPAAPPSSSPPVPLRAPATTSAPAAPEGAGAIQPRTTPLGAGVTQFDPAASARAPDVERGRAGASPGGFAGRESDGSTFGSPDSDRRELRRFRDVTAPPPNVVERDRREPTRDMAPRSERPAENTGFRREGKRMREPARPRETPLQRPMLAAPPAPRTAAPEPRTGGSMPGVDPRTIASVPRVEPRAVAPVPPRAAAPVPPPAAVAVMPRVEPRAPAPVTLRVEPAPRLVAPREPQRVQPQPAGRVPSPQVQDNRYRVERSPRSAREAQPRPGS